MILGLITVDPREYELQFFKENGFVRKQCKLCGRFFWTQDVDREVCGDSPCVEYMFINNPPTRRRYTIAEMREEFLRFFEENGHVRIKRYPVIARWREDIFLTIASIACFQPHVTSGEVPPPHNPLVMSQPSIRLADVDSVGKTGGRHLTIFEMMAHHAFNSKENFIYWKDKTVEYHHRFLTERLGIPPEEIAYIEHWWEGGGDAGPDVEGVVRGLEISTLVFMQYHKVNDSYVELPIKIVDTGYGLERFTWLSTGTPTAFETIFGSLVDKFRKLAAIERVDEKLMVEVVKQAGAMNISDMGSKLKARKLVAERIGVDALELDKMLSPIEDLYAILDHTKALMFMLGDGIVPSNVRAGYLARFLIRRTLRLMRNLGMSIPLSELISMQIDYWADQFPEFVEQRDRILEIVDLEQQKYDKLLSEGKALAQKVVKDLMRKKIEEFPVDKLAELYDSHGIPPELVREVGQSMGIKVEIPDNFDSIVASRHASSQPAISKEPIPPWVENLPPTKALYYEDPEQLEFEANVVFSNGNRVVLDQTAFYPEGGGQLSDRGILIFDGRKVNVVDVQRFKDVIVHYLDSPLPSECVKVRGLVDGTRRKALMRHHTSTHIILGAARKVLGEHVWQEGAQKDVEKSRLDISHYKRITPEQIKEIEKLANLIVMENRPVNIFFSDRSEAEKKYGFRLYQGGVVPGKLLRVVEIPGWDTEACGGLHCKSTGEIGIIKVIGVDRIQDGVERLEFVAGEAALKYLEQEEAKLKKVAELLNSPIDQVEEAAKKLSEELRQARKEIEKLKKTLSEYRAEQLLSKAITIGNVKLIFSLEKGLSQDDLLLIASSIVSKSEDALAIIASSDQELVRFVILAGSKATQHVDAGVLAKKLASLIEGKGGGKRDFGQGSGKHAGKLAEALAIIKEELR